MSERLNNLTNILQRSNPLAFLHMSAFIKPQHQKILSKIQEFGQKHLKTQKYYDHYNNATFPHYIIQEFRKLDIGKYFISKPYGQQLSLVTQGIIIASLAQYDLSFSTFLFLQLPLCGRTIFKLGSQEHKKKYLDDIIHLKKIWGWALTERNVGSNSTRVQTNFKPTQEGFILQGNKRWIGNGNNDFLIVYGNLKQQNNKNRIIGCIVENSRPGVTSKVIQNKYSLRIVQNCQIEFEKVNLPKSNMLPGANNYKEGVQNVLKHSRVLVIWNAVGACIGVYKSALQYSLKRIQFSKPIASFQLVQQKLVRIMGNLQGIILSIWRITELYQNDNNLSTAKIGMFKAWVTERARLICQLGRQILGGNGILQENYVMKALNDMEAIYTYQGSYQMNVLVAGSQLTGLKAFT